MIKLGLVLLFVVSMATLTVAASTLPSPAGADAAALSAG